MSRTTFCSLESFSKIQIYLLLLKQCIKTSDHITTICRILPSFCRFAKIVGQKIVENDNLTGKLVDDYICILQNNLGQPTDLIVDQKITTQVSARVGENLRKTVDFDDAMIDVDDAHFFLEIEDNS